MFGFLKKKEGAPVQGTGQRQPSGSSFQSTKVEDDMASFEIPDFSDEDLNFDLGIGEFMPQDGLPPVPEEQKPKAPIQDVTPELFVEEPEFKQEEPEEVYSLPVKEKAPEHMDAEIEELPKFSLDSHEGEEMNVPEKQKKEKHPKKEHSLHAHKKKEDIKHYAQASPEGFFVPKDVYRKVIILADDTLKKGIEGQEIRREFSVLSKTRKDIISSADKDAKDIKDSLLSMDSRLFGGK